MARLLRLTHQEWSQDRAARLAAALSFYTTISMAPLLMVAVFVAGIFFGEEAARGEIMVQVQDHLGEEGATAVGVVLANARPSWGTGLPSTVISVAVLLFGASRVLGQLQEALNTIWGVRARPGRGWRGMLHDRFWSFLMLLLVGVLLLATLVATTALEAASAVVDRHIAGLSPSFWSTVNQGSSFLVGALLFAMVYRYVPDVRVPWRAVLVGAVVASALFQVGKTLLGYYLARRAGTSVYGAAGSLVATLLWIYYSAQIFFFGAELTQAHTKLRGTQVAPRRGAVPMTVTWS